MSTNALYFWAVRPPHLFIHSSGQILIVSNLSETYRKYFQPLLMTLLDAQG